MINKGLFRCFEYCLKGQNTFEEGEVIVLSLIKKNSQEVQWLHILHHWWLCQRGCGRCSEQDVGRQDSGGKWQNKLHKIQRKTNHSNCNVHWEEVCLHRVQTSKSRWHPQSHTHTQVPKIPTASKSWYMYWSGNPHIYTTCPRKWKAIYTEDEYII